MTVVKKREIAKRYLDEADDRFIDMIYAMIEADNNTIIGYSTDGKPITRKGLKKRVVNAELRIKKGQYITQDALEKEARSW